MVDGRATAAFLAVFAGAVALGVHADRTAQPRRLVDFVPRGAAAVVELDLQAVRASGVARAAFDASPLRRSIEEVRRTCGRDPLEGVDALGLAVAPSGDDVALVAVGSGIRAAFVVECARATFAARGGTATVARRGTFFVVEESGAARGVLAVRDGGPIAIGANRWLSSILDVADARGPSLRGDPVHDVARSQAGSAFATLSYSAADDARAQLALSLPAEAAAVAAVPWAVVALRADEGASAVAVEVTAACGTRCFELGKWASGARALLAADPRIATLAPAVAGADVALSDAGLRLRAAFDLGALRAAFDAAAQK